MFQVNPGSKAENSGIREGDIITEINGISVINHSHEEAKQLQKSSENGLSLKLVKHWSSNKKAKSSDSEGKNRKKKHKNQFQVKEEKKKNTNYKKAHKIGI